MERGDRGYGAELGGGAVRDGHGLGAGALEGCRA
ncbi:hypothetical protein BJ982_002682 [Sphaerisporangium siamense]|uniref:Uncharacterized protein n=1 Tax=Sphaerisporangium siamense TaxID=795645 RepID=A0A7W7G7Y5_9ACTN|nr:hypothetical protein [Sphaerisporangium siamense]